MLATFPNRGHDARLVYECNLLVIVLRASDVSGIVGVPQASNIDAWGATVKEQFRHLELLQSSLTSASGEFAST